MRVRFEDGSTAVRAALERAGAEARACVLPAVGMPPPTRHERPGHAAWPARLANRIGSLLRTAGVPLGRLDEATLLAAARRRTGLDDFGETGFREASPLTVRLGARGGLTPVGARHRAPAGDRPARESAPHAAGVGAPSRDRRRRRAGADLRARAAANGHVHPPRAARAGSEKPGAVDLGGDVAWPPPERATYETDPRIARAERHFAASIACSRRSSASIRWRAAAAGVCRAHGRNDFRVDALPRDASDPVVPGGGSRDRLALRVRLAPPQLQYLQWRARRRRWVLKSPGHLWALDAAAREYPTPHRADASGPFARDPSWRASSPTERRD